LEKDGEISWVDKISDEEVVQAVNEARNRKHCQVAAKRAACAKPLMLSTLGREKGIYVGRKGRKERG